MALNAYRSFTSLLMLMSLCVYGEQYEQFSGMQLMQEVYERHQQFPYVYEEQSMVMVDRNGQRDTRKLRRYSRVEQDGTVKFLLLFEYPLEVKGTAILAERSPSGITSKYVYLPAYGEQLIETGSGSSDDNFLGTDFSVENITGEVLSDYQYVRRQDVKLEEVTYFIVDVYSVTDDINNVHPLRQHYIRQDNFYITRTDHFDKQGQLYKRQSHHDLRQVDSEMWRANMIYMENKKENHQSLIKIDRRIFSRDYVQAEIFTPEWLFRHYPFIDQLESPDEDNEDSAITDNLPDQEVLAEQIEPEQ